MKNTFFSLAALLSLTLANPQYGDPPSSSSSAASTATAAAAGAGAVQTVHVGDGGFVFTPNSLTAKKGDVIEFILDVTHSVARSTFDNPCQPINGAGSIWSGFATTDDMIFSVTVNDTAPLWLYCAAPQHCQSGMAMVVNPPSGGNTIAAYQSAAKGTSNSGTPANIAGGVFGRPVTNSASGSASGSASATAAASSSPSGGGAGSVAADVMLVGGLLFGAVAYLL